MTSGCKVTSGCAVTSGGLGSDFRSRGHFQESGKHFRWTGESLPVARSLPVTQSLPVARSLPVVQSLPVEWGVTSGDWGLITEYCALIGQKGSRDQTVTYLMLMRSRDPYSQYTFRSLPGTFRDGFTCSTNCHEILHADWSIQVT